VDVTPGVTHGILEVAEWQAPCMDSSMKTPALDYKNGRRERQLHGRVLKWSTRTPAAWAG
jgi:hypothetical protein